MSTALLILSIFSLNLVAQDRTWCSARSYEDKFGKVTISQPKVWRFDRVFSTLDGLLRDIDAVQLQSIGNLDANSVQQFMADYLTESLDIKAKFDQATLSTNALAKQVQAGQQVGNATVLEQDRQLAALSTELMKTITHQASLSPGDPESQADQTKITNLNAAITAIKQVPVPTGSTTATPSSTAADNASNQSITPVKLDDIKALIGQSSPSLPPVKKLDNFINLLHERLSRELSAILDDSSRDRDIYLMQFDVGAFPAKKATNRVLGVQLAISSPNWLAYDLYPSASAYNVAQFSGVTKSVGVSASIATLFGLGASANYQRQKDHLEDAVHQSVYTSGFGSGQRTFGWVLGSAPSEKLLTPGVHTMYALVVGPKPTDDAKDQKRVNAIDITPSFGWFPHDQLFASATSSCHDPESTFSVRLPAAEKISLSRMAYRTRYLPAQLPATDDPDKDFAYVELAATTVIDPNLVITVNGQVLKRVRDQRGRATSASISTPSQFGLLETDTDAVNSWFTTGSKNITLKISRTLATTSTFPTIRLIGSGDSGSGGMDLLSLINRADLAFSLSINSMTIQKSTSFPPTTLIPLFSSVLSPGPSIIADGASNCSGDAQSVGCIRLRIQLQPGKLASNTFAALDENSQVLLKNHASAARASYSLACQTYRLRPEDQILICDLPEEFRTTSGGAISDVEVSVERPTSGELPGFSAHAHISEGKVIYPHVVKPQLNSKGETESWNVQFALWNKSFKLTELSAGYAEEPPKGCEIKVTPNAANVDPDFEQDSFVVSRNCLSFVRNHTFKFELTDNPTAAKSKKDNKVQSFPVDDVFDWFMPFGLTVQALPDVKSVVISGKNLDAVQAIILGDYGKEVKFPPSGQLLSFRVPDDIKPGYYPVRFRVSDNGEIYEPHLSTGEGIGLQFNGPDKTKSPAKSPTSGQAPDGKGGTTQPPAQPVVAPKPVFQIVKPADADVLLKLQHSKLQ